MYRCELCNAVAVPGVPSQRVVLSTRPAEYPSRSKAQKQRIGRKSKHADDPGGAGYEIAREAVACLPCANAQEAKRASEEEAEL